MRSNQTWPRWTVVFRHVRSLASDVCVSVPHDVEAFPEIKQLNESVKPMVGGPVFLELVPLCFWCFF